MRPSTVSFKQAGRTGEHRHTGAMASTSESASDTGGTGRVSIQKRGREYLTTAGVSGAARPMNRTAGIQEPFCSYKNLSAFH
jgi:hypothetical protein